MSRPLFDPYRSWLGLVTRPRHFYDLLGVAELVNDEELIRMAAARRLGQLQAIPAEQRTPAWEDLVGKIKAARVCLLDPTQKKRYDDRLRGKRPVLSNDETSAASPVSGNEILSDPMSAASAQVATGVQREDPMAPVVIPGLAQVEVAVPVSPIGPLTLSKPVARQANSNAPAQRDSSFKSQARRAVTAITIALPSADPAVDAKSDEASSEAMASGPLPIALTPSGSVVSGPTPAKAKPKLTPRSTRRISSSGVFILGIVSFALLIGAFVWIVQVWIRPSQRIHQAEMAAQPSSARDLPLPRDARDPKESSADAKNEIADELLDESQPAAEPDKATRDERPMSDAVNANALAVEATNDTRAMDEVVSDTTNEMSVMKPSMETQANSPAMTDTPTGDVPKDEAMDTSSIARSTQGSASSASATDANSSASMETVASESMSDASRSSQVSASSSVNTNAASATTVDATMNDRASSGPSSTPSDSPLPVTASREPTEKERRQILAALKMAKRAIKDLRMDVAQQQLEKAESMADGTTLSAMVERLTTIFEFNRQFWEAVDQGLDGLAGQEIEVEGEPVMIVEVDAERLVIHRQGRNQRVARRRLPPRLAMAIANRRLVDSDAVSYQIRGSFLAVHAANRQLAEEAWEKAESMGADVQQLVLSLEDRYDPPSSKGRSVNKKDKASQADAAAL